VCWVAIVTLRRTSNAPLTRTCARVYCDVVLSEAFACALVCSLQLLLGGDNAFVREVCGEAAEALAEASVTSVDS
jgi:hypothetical protein